MNQVGAQTEIIFDGGSLVFDGEGALKAEMSYFEEELRLFDLQTITEALPIKGQQDSDIAQIHDALILGIRDYFSKSDFRKAVLGLSGGIDSAVVCALACKALGPENVTAVLMPSKYSSPHSIKDAMDLVNAIGCKHEIIGIAPAAKAFDEMMAASFAGLPFNLTEENIQARCRGIVLMAMSNKFGYILLNTSNKSECAVGYGTLYGDMCGAIGVIGDVYKTQVFQLARYLNKDKAIIPENTIIKPPSAELRPDQKDSDSLPDYEVLDKILFQHIELKKGWHAIVAAGFDESLVRRVLKMVNQAEFKRYQTPPILRVSPKAFGMGRRMPIVGKYRI
ncbi:Glutamine-dependent NAD(+) synthetase [compost metagenome]